MQLHWRLYEPKVPWWWWRRPYHHHCHPRHHKMSILLWLVLFYNMLPCGHGAMALPTTDNNDVSCQEHCRSNDQGQYDNAPRLALRPCYLLLLHDEHTLQYAAVELVRQLRYPGSIILVHVDTKIAHTLDDGNLTALHREMHACPCGTAFRMASVHDVAWSHWSMNEPTLWGLQVAVQEFAHAWDIWINLAAADTWPVLTPAAAMTTLASLPYNFVTSSSCSTGLVPTPLHDFPTWWHKYAHYTLGDTLDDPIIAHVDEANGDVATMHTTTNVTIHFGSQWVILRPPFCHWLVEQLQRPDSLASRFRDYLVQHRFLMTDETFIPTLMAATTWSHTLPKLDDDGLLLWPNGTVAIADGLLSTWALRYERMDENVPTAWGELWTNQRYDVVNSSSTGNGAPPVPRPWGPYYLGVYDLGDMRAAGALYTRKLSRHVDDNMYTILPVAARRDIPDISWPSHYEIRLTRKPDWTNILARRHEQNAADSDENEDDREEL